MEKVVDQRWIERLHALVDLQRQVVSLQARALLSSTAMESDLAWSEITNDAARALNKLKEI